MGLLVVSTRVGGVPEVLPTDMMRLAEPDARSLQACLEKAIRDVLREDSALLPPAVCHDRIRQMYSWTNVAERTEVVYGRAMLDPVLSVRDLVVSSYSHCGLFSRILMIVLSLLVVIGMGICEYFLPGETLRCSVSVSSPTRAKRPKKRNGCL